MGVVIVGGNECMVCQYEKICKQHGCKAKVFAKKFTPAVQLLYTLFWQIVWDKRTIRKMMKGIKT